MNTKVYRTRKNFKLNDTFLWLGRHWRVIAEYPQQNWFDDVSAYCVEPLPRKVVEA